MMEREIDRPRLLTTGKRVGGREPFLCYDIDCDSRLEVHLEVGGLIFAQ